MVSSTCWIAPTASDCSIVHQPELGQIIDLKAGKPVSPICSSRHQGETIDLNPRLVPMRHCRRLQRTGMLYLNSWEIFRVMKFVMKSDRLGLPASKPVQIPEITGYHVAMNR
jgi:hypothetical protein